MAQSTTRHIFISYSRNDGNIMRQIVNFLRSQGINVWVDNEKLIPGTALWEEEIEKAIKYASAIVVIMSPAAKNSKWVRREISLADQYHQQIFPVLVSGDEDSSITLRLVTHQYVDLRQKKELGMNSLAAALFVYLDQLKNQEQESRDEARPFLPDHEAKAEFEKEKDTAQPTEDHTLPECWKAVGFHLMFGFGLFYLDNKIRRKWLYPLASLGIIAPVALYYNYAETRIGGFYELYVGLQHIWPAVLLLSIAIYLIGFIDVISICGNRRRNSPS